MRFLKKILGLRVIQFLKSVFGRGNWIYWTVGLAVVILIVLLIFFLKRKRTKVSATDRQEARQKALFKASLVKIWKKFLREIPAKFRRSIMLYKPYVVLGESGVGKSLLIDHYTDWQGQAHKFYPSYTKDPVLQIYLGSKVIVQELSAALLADNSKLARAALLNLWKPLFRRKEPTVVIVLNGTALLSDTPESLKRQAQMIRGKINLLSLIRKKPVKVCIALTHMDQIEGFLEFSGFLRQNNIPLKLEFASKKDLRNLEACLEPYEDYLSLALTNLPSGDYLKIISFLRRMPERLSILSTFTKILQNPDPLSLEPEIIRLSLTSQKEGSDSELYNPFASSIQIKEVKYDPFLTHKWAAAALVILGLAYLSFGYFYQNHLLSKTNRAMNVMEASPPAQYNEEMHHLFLDCTARQKQHPLLYLFPDFFDHIDQKNRLRFLKNIREFYLFPELKRFVEEEVITEKVIYLLGLIYATKDNDLGKFILERISEWKKDFAFSEILINDYVAYNDIPQDLMFPYINFAIPIPSLNRIRWMVFFRKALDASEKSFLNKAELLELQEEANLLLQDINEHERYDFYINVFKLLDKEAPSVFKTIRPQESERPSELKQEPIREFLDFIQHLDMNYPEVKELNLYEFLENIKAMEVLSTKDQEKKFRFKFADKEFLFSAQKWNELIECSRITLFIRDFAHENKSHNGLLFFQRAKEFPDLLMNPSNKGLLFFTGKGKVDGVYTKDAFERAVKPVLLELPEFLKGLPIAEEEKTLFSYFISKEVEVYAEDYVSEYRNYYKEFNVQSSSLGELQYILTQIQLPSSEFLDFLLTIKENITLDLADSPYLQLFSLKLRAFDFIQRLMEKQKGVYIELEKYKAILKQMKESLISDKPFVAQNETDESNELKNQLSPLGRISLAIFRSEDDSYLNLMEKWLENIGIGFEWQDLFLAPVHDAYLLGLNEVQAMVNKVWDDLWVSNIQPVVSKLPFNRNTTNEVSLDEMEMLVHPNGYFWKTFRKSIAPVCLKTGDTWSQRTKSLGSLQLAEDMIGIVNNITQLTNTFWDKNGIPQPIIFFIKPLSLPQMENDKPIALLSYLRTGKSSVFGFNQQPTWQKFEFQWWENQNASVGVEFVKSAKSRKNYMDLTVPESTWSFYQLLRKGEIVNGNVLMWRINIFATGTNSNKKNTLDVKFAIKNDPWTMFQLF